MLHMPPMKQIAPIALALLLAAPAWASQTADAARAQLLDGRYADAQATALSEPGVDGLLVAAEAMAAEIMLMKTPDAKDTAKAALKLTDRALEMDPGNTEALFLKAMHQGFRTRSSSKLSIVMGGMIGDTKDDIEAFATAAPGDPRADALRGAWHLGIVRAAGDGKFGASLDDGMAAYDRAVAALPGDVNVLSNYAFSLIVLDKPQLLPRAKELLGQLEATPATDAFARETKARMMTLKAVADDYDALQAAARVLLNTEEVSG